MVFFKKVGEGWETFKESIVFLFKKPIFLIPIFLSWIVVAFVVLYNRYYFPGFQGFWFIIIYVYIMIVIISFSIIFANSIMLAMVYQIETGEKISFSKALGKTFSNIFKIIIISLIWALLWLFILILRALTSKARKGRKAQPSMRDAGRTLSGMNTPFSFVRLGLNMMEKAIRMTIFMTLPPIIWEREGPISGFKKSFSVIKQHPAQFLTAYSLTFMAGVLMALPLIPIHILDEIGVSLSATVWFAVIIYIGIIWTLEIYLEQMSVGILYMWHIKWLKKGGHGELSSVKKPCLLDDVHELK